MAIKFNEGVMGHPIGKETEVIGGGGSNIEQDWGLMSEEWPPVVSNGFTGV